MKQIKEWDKQDLFKYSRIIFLKQVKEHEGVLIIMQQLQYQFD